MTTISTHVLDTARGRPAAGVPVALEMRDGDAFVPRGSATTDSDGRIARLTDGIEPGVYRLRFDTGSYFAATGTRGFYPYVDVVIDVRDGDAHYHVPLLLSPFGYATYRGS
ncbi:MAG: hydroxyisourate hydrolase [Deltaproteobacteria bacterium]|nr:MAG: hydroxyisourate hydrolase [Deltaproteobacteria bacterium]